LLIRSGVEVMVQRGGQEKLSEAEVRWEVRRGSRKRRSEEELGEEVRTGYLGQEIKL
jgi:hypothetical protein